MSKGLRIGLVLPTVPGYSETFFRSKIAGLKQSGHRLLLFAKEGDREFTHCPVISEPKVYPYFWLQLPIMAIRLFILGFRAPMRMRRFYRLERTSGRSVRNAWENVYINSHILPQELDWLHFGFATMGLRRENVAKAIGARMAVSLRGFDIAIYPLKYPACYRLLWQRVDKVHTISDDLLALAYRDGLPVAVPVRKINPAIDVSSFNRRSPLPDVLDTPLQCLTVARLHWKKGLVHTLEAFALLKEKGLDFRYTIIGTGSMEEELIFTAHQLGIAEQVVFAGKRTAQEVQEAMEHVDIYLQYSLSEGFCNAVLEAQAMGCLCLVSDAEGLSENVLHGVTGWVVTKRDPMALGEQMMALMGSDSADLNRVRGNAMKRVREQFSVEDQIKSFMDFYSN